MRRERGWHGRVTRPGTADRPGPAHAVGGRLRLVRGHRRAGRPGRPRPPMGGGLFGLVAVQRAWYRLLARQRTVNLVVTHVPGPPVTLYLAGARLLELFPEAAIMGNLTLAVAVFSYAGQLNLTANARTAFAANPSCPGRGVLRFQRWHERCGR